jgi:hypothetical protein
MDRSQKYGIRVNVEAALRKKAVELGIASPDGIVIRDVGPGDPTDANVTDFKDIELHTTTVAGQEFWSETAADLTANDLSLVLQGESTGNKVPDHKAMAFYGFFDLSPVPDLVAMRFRRGSDTLDWWECEQCYAYPQEVGGMVNAAIIYEANDPQLIDMNFKAAANRYVGLNALIAERYGEIISKA